MISPRSIKISVAFSTAATRALARLDLPFFEKRNLFIMTHPSFAMFLAYFKFFYAIVRTLSVCPSVLATTFHGVDPL
jgi:hypothetical protein